ncbi:MAG: hypothetical protein VYD87_08480 [Pseudomonadota bacterium]|nr:hypothetical protein [Pseudomonadota bacterium]
MAQDWIIDVLADLRQYAIRNYHMRLAEQLDDAIVVAAAEIRAADSAREADSRRGFGLSRGPFAPISGFSGPGEEKISRPV